MTRAKPETLLKPKLLAVSVAACFALNASPLRANPNGPTVVHGSVGFNGLGTSALTITNQAGGSAIINWNGFSIGVNDLTRFQQFANLAVLNRVTGSEISSILGSLQSDGRVFLINPNGIVFGASARIDTAGLVASSLGLSDQDFLANRLRFTEVPGAGAVVNNGVIETTSGGRVYLVAPTVENNGLIQSPQGAIVLAAGKEVELVDADSPFVTVKVASAEQAVNLGTLVSDGGQIGMFGALVRNSGVIEAGGAVAGPGGEIRLVATKDLTLDAGSLVAANGTSGGNVLLQTEGGTNLISGTVEAKGSSGSGGTIDALGVRVGVVGHGLIDASGDTGGGTVRVGGDYQGANAEVQNAERTYIGSDGVIRADAMTAGDGGRVIVWADGDTRFYGSISARGGSESGNGGFVETSGKAVLEAFGNVDAGAANGASGAWLLDPTNINIVAGVGADSGLLTDDGFFGFNDGGVPPTTSAIGALAIEAAMAVYGGTGVELQATADITLQTNVEVTSPGTLTFRAGNNIDLNSRSISVNGNLNLYAADSGAGYAYGGSVAGAILSSADGGNITTRGGDFMASGASVTLGNIDTVNANTGLSGGGQVNVTATTGAISTGSIVTDGRNVVLSANGVSGTVNVGGTINTGNVSGLPGDSFGNGNVTISAQGDITTAGIVTAGLHPGHGDGGNVGLYSQNGTVTVNGNIDTRGANGFDDGFSSWYYGGTGGGNVELSSSAEGGIAGAAVSINGSILTAGGSGLSLPSTIFANDHGGGDGGDVTVGPLPGGFVVTGTIDTRGGNGGSTSNASADTGGADGGFINVSASGAVSIGSIATQGGNAGHGSDGSYGNWGGWGGSVNVTGGDTVSIGTIDTSGGAGGNAGGSLYGSATGGWGGEAGGINISGSSGVGIASILARGAAGGAGGSAGGYTYAYGGDGGDGSSVYVSSSGNVSIGSVDISGAQGGVGGVATDYAWGGSGGDGGYLSVGGDSVNIGSVLGRGGNGSNGGAGNNANGGSGGWGASVNLNASGAIVSGGVDVRGGNGGVGGAGVTYSYGGDGYYGGAVNMSGGSIFTGAILAQGGIGGTGGTITNGDGYSSGGWGGWGGTVNLYASAQLLREPILVDQVFIQEVALVEVSPSFTLTTGPLSSGPINVSGGNGGNSGAIGSSFTSGGTGGGGGDATLVGSTIDVAGPILAKGGNGGAVVNASLLPSQTAGTPTGGSGGDGGIVWVYGTSEVQVNVGGTLGALAIDVSGGTGGNGNPATSPAGNGGDGGTGGGANVVGTPDMTLYGSVLAGGGDGGVGGAGTSLIPGGTGGSGGGAGSIYLDASSITESNVGDGFIFVLAGTQFDVEGGFGGAGGINGGISGAAGATGTFVQGSDYFGTILVLDPLSVLEVNQGFQQIVEGNEDTTAFVGGEKEEEEEDMSQKELGSCKG